MQQRFPRFFPALLAFLSVGVACASLAWACTPHAELGVDARSAPPGATVELSGFEFVPNQEVQVRWGSTSGPELATPRPVADARGAFKTSVTIPEDAIEDTYTIVGITHGRDRFHGKVYRAPLQFEVSRNPAPETRTTQTTRGASPRDEGAAGREGRSLITRGVNERETGPEPGRTVSQPRGGRRLGASTGHGAGGAPFTPAARGERSTAAIPALTPVSELATAAPSGASDGATGGSGPGVPAQADAPPGVDRSGRPEAGRTPPEGSATGDLWSGLSPGRAPASLTPSPADGRAVEDRDGRGLAVTAGLVGLALATLFAGFAVAEGRRRRALAVRGARRPD